MNKLYVSGIGKSAKAHFISNYFLENNISNLVLISNEDEIENTVDDLRTFLYGTEIQVFSYNIENKNEKISVLPKIIDTNKKNIIVTTEHALLTPIPTISDIKQK